MANELTTNRQTLQEKTNFLTDLRQQLEAGKISVQDFVQQGLPVANEAYSIIARTAGNGSSAANSVNWALQPLASAGFKQTKADPNDLGIIPNLPEKYQTDVRKALLPSNLDEETRNRIVNSIPNNIDINSDQGRIEQERIRQQVESERALEKRKVERQSNLDELAGILSTRRDELYNRNIPRLKSEAQANGILNTTGYTDSLAKNLAQLQADSDYALSTQKLSTDEVNIGEATDILNRSQAMQSSGLNRDFNIADYDKSVALAKEIANLSKPQPQGKTGTQKAYDVAQLAIGGTAAASGFVR